MKAITLKTKNLVKEALTFSLILALFALGSALAPHEAHAKGPGLKQIPTIGYTPEGKYPSYDLQGDLDDMWYMSGNTKWEPQDLVGRMVYVDIKDVNKNGYKCDWICKDKYLNVVGLNPAIKANFKK
jgi:hypothetical protein